MEDRDTAEGLQSSWENVHRVPDQADAAGDACKQMQEEPGGHAPKKDKAVYSCCSIPPAGAQHQSGAQEAANQSKGSKAAGEENDRDFEVPATGEQGCFEGEAEVIQTSQKDSSLHFEEEDTCVHPAKPDFDAEAALGFDSTSEGDPEASSLAGSDWEYTFVLDRHNAKLGHSDKDAPAAPDKGRSMPQAPSSLPPSPPQMGPSPSSLFRGPPTRQAARSGSQSPVQSPQVHSPTPPCTEGGELGIAVTGAAETSCTADSPGPTAADSDEQSTAGTDKEHIGTHNSPATAGYQAHTSSTHPDPAQDGYEASGSTTIAASEGMYEISSPQSPPSSPSGVPAELRRGSELPSSLQSAAAKVAAQRRRQLDAVGVIPGGRAAFGAKLPSHEVSQGDSLSAAGEQQRQQAARSARPLLPELARPAAPDWARPRGRGSGSSGSLGGSASGPGAAAAMLLRRLQTRPGPAALDGRRAPATARRMEVRALPGAMLECYDSLWHGGSGIVASQS